MRLEMTAQRKEIDKMKAQKHKAAGDARLEIQQVEQELDIARQGLNLGRSMLN